MPRYLRQLAEQALGAAPGLRPLRPASGMVGGWDGSGLPLPPDSHADCEEAPVPQARSERQGKVRLDDHAAVVPPRAARLATDAAADIFPRHAVRPAQDEISVPPRDLRTATATIAGNAAAATGSGIREPSTAPASAMPSTGHPGLPRQAVAAVVHAAASVPATRMPAAPGSAPLLPPMRRDIRAARAAAPPAAPPEVHVHIGRIELVAATPASPARREEVARRKPMSLDEYLGTRGGGGR